MLAISTNAETSAALAGGVRGIEEVNNTAWAVLIALLAFNWLHSFATGPTVETAYFLPQGHKGEDGYFDPYKMQYSADRMTQTVVTYGAYAGSVPHVEKNCAVLSAVTWQCNGDDLDNAMGADNGEVWCGLKGQVARFSVNWLRYYAYRFTGVRP